MLDNLIEMKMHVESDSSNESFHLRTLWFRIDDCESDSIRDRIDSRIVIQSWTNDFHVVIQQFDFECQCSDFDECSIRTVCVIRMRCDFAL
jgi:hypothetical protein